METLSMSPGQMGYESPGGKRKRRRRTRANSGAEKEEGKVRNKMFFSQGHLERLFLQSSFYKIAKVNNPFTKLFIKLVVSLLCYIILVLS